nr:major capsid protein [uncultured Mediterranean phage uvMED]
MSEISKLLQESHNPQQRLMAETRGLVSKWEKTGLLEGISSDTEKSGMSILLENQAKQLIDEASRTGTSNNSEEWSGVALPLVRRVFAEIASKEFVSVQPMNLPSGLIFYLDFKYGTGQSLQGSGSLFGGTNGKTTDEATGGLYGEGRHGYSINDVSVSLAASSGKITLPGDADLDGVRAFTYTDSADAVATVAADGSVKVGDAAAADGAGTLQYHKKTTDVTRGDFEDNNVNGGESTGDTGLRKDIGIPEVNLELKSEPIVAKTRKLKAVWTPELAQDLNAYHSIDAEAELTSLLSEYVSMEIDLEILDMLMVNAGTVDSNAFDATPAAFQGGETQGTHFQKLGTKIQKMSNTIHQLTLRGGANFLVCSPQVATVLESIPGYAADTDGNQSQFAMGVTKVGALNNRFQVYKNPYMTSGDVLVGFRGTNFLETGAVYAPYIPLIQTPLVYDPVNFTPRRGVMTRYAKKMVRPEFYGKLSVTGTDTL